MPKKPQQRSKPERQKKTKETASTGKASSTATAKDSNTETSSPHRAASQTEPHRRRSSRTRTRKSDVHDDGSVPRRHRPRHQEETTAAVSEDAADPPQQQEETKASSHKHSDVPFSDEEREDEDTTRSVLAKTPPNTSSNESRNGSDVILVVLGIFALAAAVSFVPSGAQSSLSGGSVSNTQPTSSAASVSSAWMPLQYTWKHTDRPAVAAVYSHTSNDIDALAQSLASGKSKRILVLDARQLTSQELAAQVANHLKRSKHVVVVIKNAFNRSGNLNVFHHCFDDTTARIESGDLVASCRHAAFLLDAGHLCSKDHSVDGRQGSEGEMASTCAALASQCQTDSASSDEACSNLVRRLIDLAIGQMKDISAVHVDAPALSSRIAVAQVV